MAIPQQINFNSVSKCKGKSITGINCSKIAEQDGYCCIHHVEFLELEKQKEQEKMKFSNLQKKAEIINSEDCILYKEEDGAFERSGIINELVVAKYYISQKQNKIKRDGDSIVIFDEKTGMWVAKKEDILKSISDLKIIIYKIQYNSKKEEIERVGKPYDYMGCLDNLKKVYEAFKLCVEDTEFIQKNFDSSIGSILFKDGIYNFDTNKFTKGFDEKIVFFNRIDRNFPVRNENLIKKVKQSLFIDIFDNIKNTNALLSAVARAIYGDYRIRKCYFCRGETRAGKGLLTEALSQTFKDMVSSFNGDCLKYEKTSTDEAKKYMWLKSIRTNRLVISNEIAMNGIEIDGNKLKRIVSGGDSIKIRGHQEEDFHFVNRSTLFILANDIPKITPMDSAIIDRVENFEFSKTFVDGEPIKGTNQVKGDSKLKQLFQNNDEYKDSLFWVIADAYQELVKDKALLKPVLSDDMKTELEIVDLNKQIENLLLERYEFVIDDKGVPVREINDYLRSDKCLGQSVSETKIGLEINKIAKRIGNNFESRTINGIRSRINIKRKITKDLMNI
jgi:phage/plasmid-associated DNA primase